jgi:hypothetical protein
MKKTTLNYLLLAGYSIVLSIVAYLLIYAPIVLFNLFSGDTLGGFIFMLFISVFVVILNTLFILWNKAKLEDFSIKTLFFKMVEIFVPIFYLVLIVITWLNVTAGSELLGFLKGVFSTPKSLYILGTSLLGVLVYYFTFAVLFVKLYG